MFTFKVIYQIHIKGEVITRATLLLDYCTVCTIFAYPIITLQSLIQWRAERTITGKRRRTNRFRRVHLLGHCNIHIFDHTLHWPLFETCARRKCYCIVIILLVEHKCDVEAPHQWCYSVYLKCVYSNWLRSIDYVVKYNRPWKFVKSKVLNSSVL